MAAAGRDRDAATPERARSAHPPAAPLSGTGRDLSAPADRRRGQAPRPLDSDSTPDGLLSLQHEPLAPLTTRHGVYQGGDLERASPRTSARSTSSREATRSRLAHAAGAHQPGGSRWSQGQRASAEHAAHRAIVFAHTSAREVDPRAVAARAILSRVLDEQETCAAHALRRGGERFASAWRVHTVRSCPAARATRAGPPLPRPAEEARAWAAEAVEGGNMLYGLHHPPVHAARSCSARPIRAGCRRRGDGRAHRGGDRGEVVRQSDGPGRRDRTGLPRPDAPRPGTGGRGQGTVADFDRSRPRRGMRRHFEAQGSGARPAVLARDETHAALSACTLGDPHARGGPRPSSPGPRLSWRRLGHVHLQGRRPGPRDDVIRRCAGARRRDGIADHPTLASVHRGRLRTRSLRCDARRADGDGAREAPPPSRAGLAERAAGAVSARRQDVLVRLGSRDESKATPIAERPDLLADRFLRLHYSRLHLLPRAVWRRLGP